LGVNSAIKDFTKIGDDVFVTMGALVSKDIESGAIVLGPQSEVYPPSDRRNRMIVKKYFNL
jgi:acetyltransferase-like isoleucine patch superfamily enzyme